MSKDHEAIILNLVTEINQKFATGLGKTAKVVALRNFFDLERNGPVTDEEVLELWDGFIQFVSDSHDGELQYMDAIYLNEAQLQDVKLPRVVYTPFEYDTMVDLFGGVIALHDSVLHSAFRCGILSEDAYKGLKYV